MNPFAPVSPTWWWEVSRSTVLAPSALPEAIDLLIARDLANRTLVKRALEILPDRAIRDLGDEDIAKWVVVRVGDDITIGLMSEACGVRCEDAAGGIEAEGINGLPIAFAEAKLMLKMKQSPREKDTVDRNLFQQLIRNS